ncbi:MAG: bifunctional hydroxymethylpyrimidine kinase/phosphomethylpyrimidine kinase, partial [Thermodesulfobacteriota bacterium]|nr:bifunctional hydroxymethylpyrimidine kinase/phosphomethylpyrimidine kinase [Thermodesulfobacteriota bacterium]
MEHPPCILTIAGSDSGAGAGIQADLKTIAALGGYGLSVITALTAQNSLGVTGIFAPPPEFVRLQLETVLSDFPVVAAKTGMLFSSPIITSLAGILKNKNFPLVVDPVCVSQSGHRLLEPDAIQALCQKMLPLADLLTPNKPEAELLSNIKIQSPDDIKPVLEKLLSLGPKAVLLKGGHFEGDTVVDWLGQPGQSPVALKQQRVDTKNTHGTGCTLSAGIATGLGRGLNLRQAVIQAQEYLNLALRESYALGKGCGPPNHLAW